MKKAVFVPVLLLMRTKDSLCLRDSSRKTPLATNSTDVNLDALEEAAGGVTSNNFSHLEVSRKGVGSVPSNSGITPSCNERPEV